MDGVLVDSERRWAAVREQVVTEARGRWHQDAHRDMMGMSTPEWSAYMCERLEVPLEPPEIATVVFDRLADDYRRSSPLLPGARAAVARLAARWPLAVASSSGRRLIDLVLDENGLGAMFAVRVSSDDVPAGKPAPDVYLEAARLLDTEASACAAIEDSTNGLIAAARAGMRVIAIPNPDFPPSREALEAAAVVVGSTAELAPELVEA